jgi:hypothetical protein
MAVQESDLIVYCAANMPNDGVSTVGGALDTGARPLEDSFGATAVLAAVGEAGEARNLTVTGRLATGSVASEVVPLDGTNEVLSSNSYERILSLVLDASSGVRSVQCKQGSGGTVRHTINPDETKAYRLFRQSTADSATPQTWYEKLFILNTNGVDDLLNAVVDLDTDPSGNLAFDLAAAKDDAVTSTNRQTAPAGASWVEEGNPQAVPGTDLNSGEAIGVWLRLSLSAGEAGSKSTAPVKITGDS